MQAHYFMKEKAIKLNADKKIEIDLDKMIPTAHKMLTEIIEVQLSGDIKTAEKFVNSNFVWDENLEYLASKIKEINKTLNGIVESPLADELLK